jgi:hypothetical protein
MIIYSTLTLLFLLSLNLGLRPCRHTLFAWSQLVTPLSRPVLCCIWWMLYYFLSNLL